MPPVVKMNPFARTVCFSQDDLAAIRHAAAERQAKKESKDFYGANNRIATRRDDTDIHVVGLLGECAVSRLIGGQPDLRATLWGGGHDLTFGDTTVEIKTLQGYLAFQSIEHFKSDIAVLCVYDKKDYSRISVQGWTTKRKFLENSFTCDFGYGPRPVCQPAALLPISTLTTYIEMWRTFKTLLGEGDILAALAKVGEIK